MKPRARQDSTRLSVRGAANLGGFNGVRVVVLAVFFVVLIVGQLIDGTDLIFGLGVACFWTGFVALVWEFIARAVNRTRGRPNAT